MKKIIIIILILLGTVNTVHAGFFDFFKFNKEDPKLKLGASVLQVFQGGTGASTLTGCLEGNGTSPITGTGLPCGSGGGGSGGGTFSTTTSQVSGRLINYPNNATDIVVVGSNSTTTAEYWFDPNTNRYYLSGNGTSTGKIASFDEIKGTYFTGTSTTATSTIAGFLEFPNEATGTLYKTSSSTYFTHGVKAYPFSGILGTINDHVYNFGYNIYPGTATKINPTEPILKENWEASYVVPHTGQWLMENNIDYWHATNTESRRFKYFTVDRHTNRSTTGFFSNNIILGYPARAGGTGQESFLLSDGIIIASSSVLAANGVGVSLKADLSTNLTTYSGNLFLSDTNNLTSGTAGMFFGLMDNVKTSGIRGVTANGGEGTLSFWTRDGTGGAPTEKMEIDNKGRVGIGTTSPFANFAINPVAGVASNKFVIGSSTATDFIVNNAGFVGIGTVNPTTALQISEVVNTEGDTKLMQVFENTQSGFFDWRMGPQILGGAARFFLQGGNTLPNSLTTFLAVDGSGNFGIGTSSPTALLSVNAPAGLPIIAIGSSTGNLLNLDSRGNLGLGSTSPYQKLVVNGNIVADNQIESINYNLDGGGSVITNTGSSTIVWRQVQARSEIVSWTLLGDVAGSITIDVTKATYANYPTFTTLLSTSPALSSAIKNQATGLRAFVNEGDIIQFRVNGTPSSLQKVNLILKLKRI